MTFDQFNQWQPIPEKHWRRGVSADTCQAKDAITLNRCTRRIHWGNAHYCRECGVFVCNLHPQHHYRNYQVCYSCYQYLTVPSNMITDPITLERINPNHPDSIRLVTILGAQQYFESYYAKDSYKQLISSAIWSPTTRRAIFGYQDIYGTIHKEGESTLKFLLSKEQVLNSLQDRINIAVAQNHDIDINVMGILRMKTCVPAYFKDWQVYGYYGHELYFYKPLHLEQFPSLFHSFSVLINGTRFIFGKWSAYDCSINLCSQPDTNRF